MARLAGYTPGTITIQATNTHLYHSHFDAVDELLTREHLEPPKLILSDNIKQITDLNDVKGAFERIYPDDIILENYQHQAVIKAKMAV
jgi:thymidylate synthase